MPRWLPLLFGLLLPGVVGAGTFDIDANQFYVLQGSKLVPDGASFERVMAEIGVASGPKMIGPARTLGLLGFDIGYTVGLTNINESSTYWKKATKDPSNFLPTMQVNLTKGLPFSFQIEGLITHLFSSGVWALGLNLKWAVVEGYRYLPELSVATNVGTLTGTKNYTLLTFGGSALVSKRFGIGGIVEVNPYAGYHALGGRGASEVLVHFVGSEAKTFVINPVFFVRHLGVAGLVVTGGIVSGGFEAMFASGLQTFGFKASVTF
jgi:hypothetical protein